MLSIKSIISIISISRVLFSFFGNAFVHPIPISLHTFGSGPENKDGSSSSLVLFYGQHAPHGKDEDSHRFSSPSTYHEKQKLSIPVIGPIPGGLPLFVGGEMTIDSPTPMQWQALEKCIDNHQRFLKEEKKESLGANNATADTTAAFAAGGTTGITAAPLVAIIDDVTSSTTTPTAAQQLVDQTGGRYATIAAVVGISAPPKTDDDDDAGIVSDDDNSSFMESIVRPNNNRQELSSVVSGKSRIRLVGIGRASLQKFFYQLATSVHEEEDDDENHGYDDEENDDDDDRNAPVVVAEFRMVEDSDRRSESFVESGGGDRSRRCSPVHALNEMNSLLLKISVLHDERRRLVQCLRAAKCRLLDAAEGTTPSSSLLDDELCTILEDSDGLGELSRKAYDKTKPGILRDDDDEIRFLLETFSRQQTNNETTKDDDDGLDLLESAEWKSWEENNFGMGFAPSAISSIRDQVARLEEALEPYYSPETRRTEEHHFYLASFAAMVSLAGCLEGPHVSWALKCTNTIERLQQSHEWMWQHKLRLHEAAEAIGHELRKCGEECSDLW